MADPNRKFDSNVRITTGDRSLPESSRLYMVLKHLNLMLSDSDPTDHARYVLLEKFGGIAEPSLGEGVRHGGLGKAGSVGPPSPQAVLQNHFGMKKD